MEKMLSYMPNYQFKEVGYGGYYKKYPYQHTPQNIGIVKQIIEELEELANKL